MLLYSKKNELQIKLFRMFYAHETNESVRWKLYFSRKKMPWSNHMVEFYIKQFPTFRTMISWMLNVGWRFYDKRQCARTLEHFRQWPYTFLTLYCRNSKRASNSLFFLSSQPCYNHFLWVITVFSHYLFWRMQMKAACFHDTTICIHHWNHLNFNLNKISERRIANNTWMLIKFWQINLDHSQLLNVIHVFLWHSDISEKDSGFHNNIEMYDETISFMYP